MDSIVLEEEIDPNYVPSEAEVIEYAKWLGMDLKNDQDLFWVAKEGLMAPLPKNWKPCKTKDTEDIYYFNFSTGDSTWDHPCDGYYKRLYDEEKKKKEVQMKESSDQVRTRAKQDVDQLLGKGDKKRRKKSSLDTVESISAASATQKMTSLGPLTTLEKKPLPGIQPLSAPFSALPASLGSSRSGSSSTSSSGAARVASLSGTSSTRDSPTPTGSADFEPSLKTTKPSRLSSVLANSDESKIDSPQRTSDSKTTEAKIDDLESTRTLHTAEAKTSQLLSSESTQVVSSSGSGSSTTGSGNEDLIAKLRLQVRRLEGDYDIKSHQCDRFEAENADLERRLAKEKKSAKELQESHEETELKLQKQIRTLKEEVAQLDKQVEEAIVEDRQLRSSHRELMLKYEQLKTEGADSTSPVSHDAERSADLQGGVRNLEELKQRAQAENADLQEQLRIQESSFQAKLVARSEEVARANKASDELRLEVETLKSKLLKSNDATGRDTVPLSTPAMANLPDDGLLATANTQIQRLSAELSSTKIERDDLVNRSKRLEQLMTSWESDCKDKETRLQLARASCNDLEAELMALKTSVRQMTLDSADKNDKARLLEMERDALKADQSGLKAQLRELQTAIVSEPPSKELEQSPASEDNNRQLQEALEAEKASNQRSERKMRGFQEELIQLQRRLQEVKDGQVAAENAATSKIASELLEVKGLLGLAGSKILVLTAEVESTQQKTSALADRNAVLQAEADRLRELINASKSSGAGSPNVYKVSREGELEAMLQAKRDELFLNTELITSLRAQIADLQAKLVAEKAQHLSEKADLMAALTTKDASFREAEAACSRATMEVAHSERACDLAKLELSLSRKEEETERRLRMQLEREVGDLKVIASATTRPDGSDSDTLAVRVPRMFQNEGSIVELSIIVGKQQAIVAQLGSKLEEAESRIKDLKASERSPAMSALPTVEVPGKGEAHLPQPTRFTANAHNNQKDGSDGGAGADLDHSLLREMMLDFVRRRRPFMDADVDRKADHASTNWTSKITKEKKFICDARKRLRDDKVAIRLEQSGLLKRREAWKRSRNDTMIGGVARTKDVAQQLNRQTLQLNLAIDQAKRTQQWLDEREQKLDRLEELVEASVSNDDNEDDLAALGGLGKELDADATMVELEPFLPMQPSFHQPAHNQENMPRGFTFPDEVWRGESNTYMQSTKDSKTKRVVGASITNNHPPSSFMIAPETSLVNTVAVMDRRMLQFKIQREVEERNQIKIAYQEHGRWLDGLRSEIAFHTHEKSKANKKAGHHSTFEL